MSPGGTPPKPSEPGLDDIEALVGKKKGSPKAILAFVGGLVLGGGGMAGVSMMSGGDTPAPSPSASASAKPEPPPSASAVPSAEPPKLDLEDQAAQGDDAAIKKLEAIAPKERTARQQLALADARRATKLAQIADIQRKVELLPKYAREKPGNGQIKELAEDPEVTTEALRMIAGLPGDVGPDLLYELWTSTRRRTDMTELAEGLLSTKDVREKASKELMLALDIREIEECDAMAKLLEKAIEYGDRRSLVPIVKLNNKRGCGEKKLDDCWACLRDGDLIKDAVIATRKRAAP